ncbi:protein-tyrosine phosphatase family protein [Lentzea sp. NPDC055074]
MGHPAGGWLLEGKAAGLRRAGVDVLVSLQTDSERVECDLVDEERVVSAAGIRYLCLPVADGSVPDVDAAVALVRPLHEVYVGGGHVVFHCWAGVGRSSLMAGLLLGMDGVPPSEAWGLISGVRGRAVPQTVGQGEWLENWWGGRG